ncbi:DUF2752 domain-containing protein [Planobacterium oryzisoli]|uniref:DUF2752 domain-containing protein n=1 Tax=Planobacterium oryzisoli TaxID=2771435 RepID=A0A930YUE1_9FLAO|nr:DUF2752 domain-containing protein [Planobacterium oryzisoli]MBF5026554.1 DUF2752 domain-containing protein [Planobacterium oryzisoli]
MSFIEDIFLSCPYQKYLGIHCLGCGAQRAALELLEGNFAEAWHLYPAIFPLSALLLTFVLSKIVTVPSLAKIQWALLTVSVLLVFTNYYLGTA